MPMSGEPLAQALAVEGAAAGTGLLAGWLSAVCIRWLARHNRPVLDQLHRSCHRPWVAVLVVAALLAATPDTGVAGVARYWLRHGLYVMLIGTTAWLVGRALLVAEDAAFQQLPVDVVDNRRRRRIRTQVAVLRRLTTVMTAVLAGAAVLMTFDALRTFGATLAASAGLAGVVAGLAARTTLGNVFAGLQLAFTDALHLDDVVVVENEWGRVEEMGLTYVVLRLWDERRLQLPTTYFIDHPFQNWTRYEARVLGAVLLHVDYTAPVAELRTEAHRIVEASALWDRRDWVLQVVDTTPSAMVIRVLASARDGPSAWDLRCDIRESLIAYLASHCPECLPRIRADLTTGPTRANTTHPSARRALDTW